MGWLIGSIISASMVVVGISAYMKDKDPQNIFVVGLMALLCIFFFVKYRNTKNGKAEEKKSRKQEKKAKKEAQIEYARNHIKGKHQDGLPLAQDSECVIGRETDRFVFSGGGTTFNLACDKITDICMKTDKEIQKQYVSSIGGAVAGAALFGTLGAIVGGRAKQKTDTTITHYLIFTYKKNDGVSYISFEVKDTWKSGEWIKAFKDKWSQVNNSEIDL